MKRTPSFSVSSRMSFFVAPLVSGVMERERVGRKPSGFGRLNAKPPPPAV
jgi:hypothetical protein